MQVVRVIERADADGSSGLSAADLSKTAQTQTCATCPLGKKSGAEKLDLLQSLLTLR
jgi:hypothetical protein